MLTVLSSILERLLAVTEQKYGSGSGSYGNQKLTVFHGLRAPTISIDKYLDRIYKYSNCSPSCFVVAYILLDRIVQRHPDMPITSLNVHRLLISSVMVAAKFLDDAYFNNAYYAKVGGVTTGEMNRLELEFLFRIDFRLNVTSEEFTKYCQLMEGELWRMQAPSMPHGHPRGSCMAKVHGSCACEAIPMETEVGDDCTVTTPPRENEILRHPSQLARVTSFTP